MSANRSVLFVTTVDITLEAFLLPFAKHFRSQGWRVDALASGATANRRIADSFDTRYDAGWHRNPAHPANMRAAATVRGLAEKNRYDLVHVHTPVAAFVTRFALHSLPDEWRPAIIYTAHGFHFHEGGSAATNAVFRRLESTAAPWTDYLVTINAQDHAAALAFAGIDPQRVKLIPGIGVDCDRYRPDAVSDTRRAALRAELDVHPSALMVTMVAEFAPLKRHALALDALEASGRDDVVLCFAGAGPLESRLRETVAARKLGDRVRFAGYRRDVPGLLAASDALLLCSAREGLARSVLEAMATGLPVLGTDTRGIVDAVTSDVGWITARDDAAGLGASIAEAASDRAQARLRGAAGRARACAEYSIGSIITAHAALYAEALARRDAGPHDGATIPAP